MTPQINCDFVFETVAFQCYAQVLGKFSKVMRNFQKLNTTLQLYEQAINCTHFRKLHSKGYNNLTNIPYKKLKLLVLKFPVLKAKDECIFGLLTLLARHMVVY